VDSSLIGNDALLPSMFGRVEKHRFEKVAWRPDHHCHGSIAGPTLGQEILFLNGEFVKLHKERPAPASSERPENEVRQPAESSGAQIPPRNRRTRIRPFTHAANTTRASPILFSISLPDQAARIPVIALTFGLD